MKTYYDVLGLSPTSSPEEIKKTFRDQALTHHPDRRQTPPESVVNVSGKFHERRMKLVNEAYEVLSDPEKRSRYDRLIASDTYPKIVAEGNLNDLPKLNVQMTPEGRALYQLLRDHMIIQAKARKERGRELAETLFFSSVGDGAPPQGYLENEHWKFSYAQIIIGKARGRYKLKIERKGVSNRSPELESEEIGIVADMSYLTVKLVLGWAPRDAASDFFRLEESVKKASSFFIEGKARTLHHELGIPFALEGIIPSPEKTKERALELAGWGNRERTHLVRVVEGSNEIKRA